jgi:hypothetical protein
MYGIVWKARADQTSASIRGKPLFYSLRALEKIDLVQKVQETLLIKLDNQKKQRIEELEKMRKRDAKRKIKVNQLSATAKHSSPSIGGTRAEIEYEDFCLSKKQ